MNCVLNEYIWRTLTPTHHPQTSPKPLPKPLQTPDEEMGIPGQWESVKKPSDFTTSPTSSEINEMEGWEPEKVPLPAWAVDGKVVGTGLELKDGAEEFSEYARGFKDGGELAESIAKKQRNG